MVLITDNALTNSLLTALASVGEAVGDNEAPVNATALLEAGAPYVVLTSTGVRGDLDGPAGAPFDDGGVEFQLTCVGVARQQAADFREDCRAAILSYHQAGSLTPGTGRAITGPLVFEGGPITRDDQVQPPVHMAVDIFVIHTVGG